MQVKELIEGAKQDKIYQKIKAARPRWPRSRHTTRTTAR